MRAIDADKLKRKAQKVGTEAWKMNLTAKVETTLNQFIDWIDEQPTVQPKPQWIPVKREVPENPGYYITSSEYGDVTVDFYYDHFWNARKNAYKVLAWMPLPEPYKPNK